MNSKWSEQQKVKEEIRKENRDKEKTSRETLGKYFYDLSKLSFTALCLGGGVSLVLDVSNTGYWLMLLSGVLASFGFAYIGFKVIKK